MPELLPSNFTAFFERFAYCYDGFVRDVELNYVNRKATVILSVQDQETHKDHGWVNLTLEIEDVTRFILIEDKSTCVVLSGGLQVGFYDAAIYLDFCPYTQEPDGIDDFNKSHFLIVGKRCRWVVASYTMRV